MTLENKIKDRREELKLTQQELAQRSRLAQSYISRVENDVFVLKATTLLTITVVLGLLYDALLKYNDEKEVV